MKPSLYNYYIKTDDDKLLIVFNGLTKSFFLVTIQNADSIKYVINHPNEYIERKEFLSLINSLSSKGFILEDNISELDCIERDYYQYINSDTYLLLILTTYNCNFNCWYCVQEHNNEFLSSETSGRIKKHIAKYLIENNIKIFSCLGLAGNLRSVRIQLLIFLLLRHSFVSKIVSIFKIVLQPTALFCPKNLYCNLLYVG